MSSVPGVPVSHFHVVLNLLSCTFDNFFRKALSSLAYRHNKSENEQHCSKSTNYRYLSTPEKLDCMHHLIYQNKKSKVFLLMILKVSVFFYL